MLKQELLDVIRKFTVLAHTLNSVIASGQNKGISVGDVYREIDNESIIPFLNQLGDVKSRGLANWSLEEKARLLDEWQRLRNAITYSDLGIERSEDNGINLLLGYVIEGIQSRAYKGEIWP